MQPYQNGYQLVTSKVGASRPMTSTKLETEPCMLPYQVSIVPDSSYYPTERDMANGGCTAAKTNGMVHDDRFKNLGMPVSELDIQWHSGVYNYLMTLPLGPYYVNQMTKSNTPYGFWARETI